MPEDAATDDSEETKKKEGKQTVGRRLMRRGATERRRLQLERKFTGNKKDEYLSQFRRSCCFKDSDPPGLYRRFGGNVAGTPFVGCRSCCARLHAATRTCQWDVNDAAGR